MTVDPLLVRTGLQRKATLNGKTVTRLADDDSDFEHPFQSSPTIDSEHEDTLESHGRQIPFITERRAFNVGQSSGVKKTRAGRGGNEDFATIIPDGVCSAVIGMPTNTFYRMSYVVNIVFSDQLKI